MARVDYFNLSIPAARRLAMMRADFAGHAAKYPHCPERAKPASWRAVRAYGLHNWQSAFATLDQGANDGTPVWYTHAGPEFRDERRAHDIKPRLPRGYYTDEYCSDTAIGIVSRLPHGRLIVGYLWTSNGERVYYPDVYTDEEKAAHAADSHAESFADDAREDSERFKRMQDAETAAEDALQALRDAETAAEDALQALRDAWALRRAGRRSSDQVCNAIQALRDAREESREAGLAYERG